MAANHTEIRNYNLPVGAFVDKIRRIPYSGLKIKLQGEIPMQYGVQFTLKAGVNMLSWGEDITLTLTATGTYTTSVRVYSECVMPTQIIDWGKNKKNVRLLFAYLEN